MRAAGVLLEATSTGRVLLLRRSSGYEDAGLWETPGGHIERRERPIDAARRELVEETGYRGPVRLIGEMPSDDGYTLFFGEVREEFRPRLSPEHDRYVWWPKCHWPNGTRPQLVPMMSCY